MTEQAQRYPDLVALELATPGLAPRDAALAHAIYDAAIRRWITIAYLAETVLGRRWSQVMHPLQGAILAGAAQLLFMDRVPAYAAINESVEWAKRSVSPSGAGLVNAALRGLGRVLFESETKQERTFAETYDPAAEHLPLADGRALVLRSAKPLLPTDALTRLAVTTSHPRALIEAWVEASGVETTAVLTRHSLCDPPIVLNARYSGEAFSAGLAAHATAGSAVLNAPHEELAPLLSSNPRLWVQDSSASEAVESACDLSPSLIVDLCAGQGTKTRHLACVFPKARILATDTDGVRLRALREVARHFPTIEVADFEDITRNFVSKADLVLLDVPCSNTGVLPRRPEARYRTATSQLDRLVKLQRDIMRQGVSLLAPSGTLLYSTCSIEKAENEEQVLWSTAHLPLTLHSQRRTMPAGLPGEPATQYRDGSFSARLTKA